MYINNVHILVYVAQILVAMISGDVVGFTYKYFLDKNKNKNYFKTISKHTPSYIFMGINIVLYCILLYFNSNDTSFIGILNLLKSMILIPFLEIAFMTDIKEQIIPNRLTLTLLETGLGFTFIYALSEITIAYDMLLGMVVGAGIFLLITLVGGLMYGKETMGFGDIKLVGALGLFFGMYNIVLLTLIAFLIGAIFSLIMIIIKKKNANEYIAFAPFIVIAALILIFVPSNLIKTILMNIFTLGAYSKN